MNGTEGYIDAGSEQLHYLEWGSGRRLLLAFHGYGDDAEVYGPIREYLETEFTVISVNLPHHGNSKWSNTSFSKQDLLSLVGNLRVKYGVEKVSLIGYSMGGRVCLVIMEHMPASIEKVVLMASDGLIVNPYYYFFTRTAAGRKMFRNMLEKPAPYLGMVNLLKKLNLVHTSRHKFVMHFMQSEESRQFLLKVWPGMSDLMPNLPKLKRMIRQYQMPVTLFMGANDKIIPVSAGRKFIAGLKTVQMVVLDKGHRLLDSDTAKQIADHLI